MASLITTSVTGYAKEGFDKYIYPLFAGMNPFQTPGMSFEPNVRGKKKLNYFSNTGKFAKAYTRGWTTPGSLSSMTQREIETFKMKAEASQAGDEFFDTVYAYALNKGIDWSNITQTVIEGIVMEIWGQGLASDIFRQYWLGDTKKEDITSGVYNGTADDDYNAFDGMWKLLISNATTTPTTNDHIKRYAFSNGAVAQVATVTLTGTGGTANITLGGKTYLATFATDLATTALNFKTAHAAALLLRGVVVTNSGDTVVFTSAIAGMPFAAPTIANVTTNLSGSVAATTANTAPADLSADEALTALKALHTTCDPILKAVPNNQKAFLVSATVYENYLETLEGKSATGYTWTDVNGREMLINGSAVLKFRGIMVINMNWDNHLTADFPTAYPHRIIYTEANNLVIGFDDLNDQNAVKAWYDENAEENRYRTKYFMGVQYRFGKLTAVAY